MLQSFVAEKEKQKQKQKEKEEGESSFGVASVCLVVVLYFADLCALCVSSHVGFSTRDMRQPKP